MSRMVERGEFWWAVNRMFACEQCNKTKSGYLKRPDGELSQVGDSELCAPPLGWTVKDDPARFFCSIECVDKYDARVGR